MFGDTPPTVIAIDPAIGVNDMVEPLRAQFLRQPTWLAIASHPRNFDPDADLARAHAIQQSLAEHLELPIITAKPGNWPRNAIACLNTAHDELGQAWPLGGVAPLRAGVALCRELATTRLRIWSAADSHFLREGDAVAMEMAQEHGIEFRVESPVVETAP